MKKTQVALAALALVASTAAMAQVTIYGTMDAGVANTTGSGTYVSGAGGYSYGNNIGFKGSEDLGGGLTANFQLEGGFALNSGHGNNGGAGTNYTYDEDNFQGYDKIAGSVSSPFFNRVSTVGLSGAFGSVTIGQQLSPFIGSALSGVLSNGHFGVNRLILGGSAAYPGATTSFNYGGFFIPNAISYTSPSMSGFTATVLTSTKTGSAGGALPEANPTDRYTAMSVGGSIETIKLGFATENRAQSFRNMSVSASTEIGDLQLAANYMSVKNEGANSMNSLSLGVGYNLTSALNVNLQHASNTDAPAGNNLALTALTGKYTLSKRTSLYASYLRGSGGAQSSYDNRAIAIPLADGVSNTTAVVGVAHSF